MFPTSSQLVCSSGPPVPTRRLCTRRLQHGLALSTFARGLLAACHGAGLRARRAPPPQAMAVERDLHMATGDGEGSYAANSSFQRKNLMQTWPELRTAMKGLLKLASPAGSTMVVADLGCSSGPNTLLVVSELVSTIGASARAMEVQCFLNDLPGNDFNLLFQSLEHLHSLVEEKASAPAFYIAGLPGSMYTRIFPCQSVHLFHSCHCLTWRSKVPEQLANGTHMNDKNIYIGKTTPPAVVKLFQEQFENDFQLFLTLRYKELVRGGRMMLTFTGRKSEEMPMDGVVASIWELLSKALQYLVQKGRIEKKKLSSFNMPYYAPSLDEVKQLIKQNNLFEIEHIRLFESNWDAYDDSDGDVVFNCSNSGKNIAKTIRAGIGPLIVKHFGKDILDELFATYASILAKHLEKGKALCPIIVVILKKSND